MTVNPFTLLWSLVLPVLWSSVQFSHTMVQHEGQCCGATKVNTLDEKRNKFYTRVAFKERITNGPMRGHHKSHCSLGGFTSSINYRWRNHGWGLSWIQIKFFLPLPIASFGASPLSSGAPGLGALPMYTHPLPREAHSVLCLLSLTWQYWIFTSILNSACQLGMSAFLTDISNLTWPKSNSWSPLLNLLHP